MGSFAPDNHLPSDVGLENPRSSEVENVRSRWSRNRARTRGSPNIIVILAGDLGYRSVGFNGCQDIPTPNIDSLAANGLRCSNAYATHPFCSPSRAPLLTGRYLDRVAYMTTPTAGLVGDDRCTRRWCGTSLQALQAQKPHAISVPGAATGSTNQIGRPPACPTRRATWRGSPSRTRPASYESFFARFTISVLAQIMTAGFALGQVLTHGPVVGGVTDSSANVFVRTDQRARVALWYGTDPNLGTHLMSERFRTSSAKDFTKIIPLTSLTAETTYYMNVIVNGMPQSASPPYPSFTTFAPSGTSRTFNFIVLTDFVTTNKLRGPVQTFAWAAAESPVFALLVGTLITRTLQPSRTRG